MIRPYVAEDARRLAALHNRVFTDRGTTLDGFREWVEGTLDSGGLVWVVAEPQLIGFALIRPVPGLQGVGDLTGCIVPERQRKGLGSRLLRFVIEELKSTDFWQIAHCVTSLDSPAASFLRQHDFFVEHEEWLLELDDFSGFAEIHGGQSLRLQTFARETAVSLFCRLYEESFNGLPWNEPFERSEVWETLPDSRDMLFLTLNGDPIGFAWIGLDANGKGLIEPLGIVRAEQRKGYGRALLLRSVQELAQRGAKRVEIGAWLNNKAAIHLYTSLGFRHRKTFTYLAANVKKRR
ncbi:MAG: GNAT family N-acetyltransferase [Chloroflexi bacterium]|jgi:ribosomal protein S18 acetylase RimI-like enzyme|nr:GNAT family N-acetyltransferase [Chloroflexota bacterium]